MKDEADELLKARFGAFARRVELEYLSPKMKHNIHDESPDGFYPSIIVPMNLNEKIVYVVPEKEFEELFKEWKETHPKLVKASYRATQRDREKRALKNLRNLFDN